MAKKKKNIYENMIGDLLNEAGMQFPENKVEIENKALALYAEYCKEEEGKSEKITMHTVDRIFPCIAVYKAIIEVTGEQEKAYHLIDDYFRKYCEVVSAKLQKVCGIPFVYRFVPRIATKVIHTTYGVASGFTMIDHSTKGKVCHIDMTSCPYFSHCVALGCKELTVAFCNSDDITFGNMHPKLSWDRTKTLGRGDAYCDFIIRIKE